MSVPLAYIGVIIIWSTTPLAIKWSGETSGFLFGVTARMVIGLALSSLLLMIFSKRKLPWHSDAIKTYLVAGIAIYGSMLCVYWGAQYITSGFISVIFGLTPILTGVMAAMWLNERSLTIEKMLGVGLGITGLVVIFKQGMHFGSEAVIGIAAMCVAVILHSGSGVWFKKLKVELSALEITHGGLMVSVPLYLVTWLLIEGTFPTSFSERAVTSIIYLGMFGSVLGFVLFYYILKHVEVSRVSLIPLITPVLALLLGNTFNNEVLTIEVWTGTFLILMGMSFYHFGDKLTDIVSSKWMLIRS